MAHYAKLFTREFLQKIWRNEFGYANFNLIESD